MRKTSALIDDPKVAGVVTPLLSCRVMQNRSDDCPPHSALRQRASKASSSSSGWIRSWVEFAHLHDEQPCLQPYSQRKLTDFSTVLLNSTKTYGRRFTLFLSVSASLTEIKSLCPRTRHAAWMNTQFILSKWITYLICKGAVIIIWLAHKHYTHSLPVNKAY